MFWLYKNADRIEAFFLGVRDFFISPIGILVIFSFISVPVLMSLTIRKLLQRRRERIEERDRKIAESLPPEKKRESHEEYLKRMAKLTEENQKRLAEEYEATREEREKEEAEEKKRREEEGDRQDIKKKLNEVERVYLRESLSDQERDILLESGYQQVNEYDILERRIICVLVKPVGNHSVSHTFLVWSAKRLLEDLGFGVEEYLTVEPDLTFISERKGFAIEVECGSLLGKKKQLANKIKDLNKKYPNRWMFLVKHRDLAPKYRKYGPTSTRKDFSKKLAKC